MPRTRRKPPNRKRARKGRGKQRHGISAFLPDGAVRVLAPASDASLRLLKLAIGLLLIPFGWVALETFLVLLKADTFGGGTWRSPIFLSFAGGSVAWLALFYCARCRAMMWLYVAGHELTHALFVLLCSGKVSKIHVSAEGGHVLTNRNNFLISLSPYFFPFYTVAAIAVWGILQWIFRESGGFDPVWLYGAIGFTWMFHLSFTLWMVRREQPDVEQNGKVFSFSLIFLMNVLLICALLVVVSPTATFAGLAVSLWENLKSLPVRFLESAAEIIRAMPF